MLEKSLSLLDQVKNTPELSTKQSLQWYTKNVTQPAKGMSVQKFLSDNSKSQATSIYPGQLISFIYSAKTAESLKWWDSAPLVLPFETSPTHFTGLNLHYLDYRGRMVLLDKLMTFSNDDRLTPKARMKISWNLLKSASNFPGAQHCVKQYIFSHVKSKFIVIPPEAWRYVIHLPLAKFNKATQERVWQDTRSRK